MVFAFDWGGTLENHESIRKLAREFHAAGHIVCLVPALSLVYGDESALPFYREKMLELGIPNAPIYRVGDQDVPACKVNILKRIEADYFWDDNHDNVKAAIEAGIKAYHVDDCFPVDSACYFYPYIDRG